MRHFKSMNQVTFRNRLNQTQPPEDQAFSLTGNKRMATPASNLAVIATSIAGQKHRRYGKVPESQAIAVVGCIITGADECASCH